MVEMRLNKKGDQAGPWLVCAATGQVITNASTAIVLFSHTPDGAPAGPWFVVLKEHSRAFEADHPEVSFGWMPLDMWLRCLCNNAGYSEQRARDAISVMSVV